MKTRCPMCAAPMRRADGWRCDACDYWLPSPRPTPLILLFCSICTITMYGCPGIPDGDRCTPSATRCHEGRPQVCAQTSRWVEADQRCTDIGGFCCEVTSLEGNRVHACAPLAFCNGERDE